MAKESIILFCNCSYFDIIPEDVKSKILEALKESGIQFEAVTDLCEMSAKNDPALKHYAKADSIKVVACYPRVIRWLFHAGQAPLNQESLRVLNMRTVDPENILSELLTEDTLKKGEQKIEITEKGDWIPWFPVIDYDRCKNCMQCLNFCLFGVYELSDQGTVEVAKPSGCKTNCPACARVCPHSAIIFPKYAEAPINGDEVFDNDTETQRTDEEAFNLKNADIYEMVRQRSSGKKRFAKDKPDNQQINISELTEKLNIPLDVLTSLSGEEISYLKKQAEGERGE
ncbi:MAG: ferredoxin family protein [Planctomycetota bacterium]|jgi:NAD-dependent dihydropyrimidine dehydrogenase PreA subunit